MQVFKFGGASVQDLDHIKNVGNIIRQYADDKLVIVVSAMGKTTNALEKVAEAFYNGKKEEALSLFEGIKKQHITLSKYLLVTHFNPCLAQLSDFFTEIEWLLHDKPVRDYAYYYDQIVCVGELLSTCIISYYLNEIAIENTWIDVRDILRTDDNFREAIVDWNITEQKVKEYITPVFSSKNIIITQGFIGCTDENESTTLGREGSDFTAAIFANLLNAKNLTIWKDVSGVMNADPKRFPDAQLLDHLSFSEVIEMAYYGAQVIHPKTIKPIQNKSIPLYVKCFLDTSLPGTVIDNNPVKDLPPIIILKNNQALLHLTSMDFSFVGEKPMSRLYTIFGELNVRPNLIQTGAIHLQICLDDREDKITHLAQLSSETFDVQVEKELNLLTIRHYNAQIIDSLIKGKERILVQQTEETMQVLFR